MNLILVGFMASGKSAVGRRLAHRLGYGFVDTDQVIEEQIGCSIAMIFEQKGEPYFRKLESALAANLSSLHNYIISTGGGMIATPGNLEALKKAGRLVFLNADLEDILERLQRDTNRPKAQGEDLRERMGKLLEARMPYYTQSDYIINTHGKSVNRVAGEVLALLSGKEGKAGTESKNSGEPPEEQASDS